MHSIYLMEKASSATNWCIRYWMRSVNRIEDAKVNYSKGGTFPHDTSRYKADLMESTILIASVCPCTLPPLNKRYYSICGWHYKYCTMFSMLTLDVKAIEKCSYNLMSVREMFTFFPFSCTKESRRIQIHTVTPVRFQ